MFFEASDIPHAVLMAAQAMVGLAMLLAGWRIMKGPDITDRIVALDLLGSLLIAQFILLVCLSGFTFYLDVAAVIAVISFLATVAFARYLEHQERGL